VNIKAAARTLKDKVVVRMLWLLLNSSEKSLRFEESYRVAKNRHRAIHAIALYRLTAKQFTFNGFFNIALIFFHST